MNESMLSHPTMTMKRKRCGKCRVLKGTGMFYKHRDMKGGLQSVCKGCTVVNSREWRVNNKSKRNCYFAKDRKLNPEKHTARQKATRAIRKGTLVRCPCEVCGSSAVEAHHCDYLKPLDVMWLCRKHHALWHQHLTAYDNTYRPEDDPLVKILMSLKYGP
jgi:hypothetical protein